MSLPADHIYKKQAIVTARPAKLIDLLFEGALQAIERAKNSAEDQNFIQRNENMNRYISKAQLIIRELQASLDLNTPGDLAPTLYRLYDYFCHLLIEANLKKSTEPLNEVQAHLAEIQQAWKTVLNRPSSF